MAASVTVLPTEYHNSRQIIIILFWKYLVDIKSEAWLNRFWDYINGKLVAVHSKRLQSQQEKGRNQTDRHNTSTRRKVTMQSG